MTRRLLLSAALFAGFTAAAPAAHPSPEATLEASTIVLDELARIPLRGIPPALLADAHGVAVIPRVVKAGFIIGGRGGHGVVLERKDGVWGVPTFVSIGGASIGFQAGVEAADVVLVFKSRKSLDRILEGKGKVTLGVDAAIAAGPVGRQAEAGTDGRLQAEIVSYSRSRGLFAGIALDGAALVNDRDANAAFAQYPRPENLRRAEALRAKLTEMSSPAPVLVPAPVYERGVIPPPVVLAPPVMPAPARRP